ncbi:MAG: oxidoreductase [Sphingobacteriales bacterium]|nr:oxidoreductase [Sphingobacteriales bacterium]
MSILKRSGLLSFLLPALLSAQSPTVQLLSSGTATSIRGLSVVSDQVIWVSGSNGTIGRSTDGGQQWKWSVVKGFEKKDFRDIEAFDANTAIIMSVEAPAYILKTTNGGDTWKIVYENNTKGMFLDAMEFWNEKAGIVIGDPVEGKFFVTRTFDGGQSWNDVPVDKRPVADSGEACFAASGTNLRVLDRDEAVFVSGGFRSRLFSRKAPVMLPILQGKESTGANSVAVWDDSKLKGGKNMIIAGGDFNIPSSTEKNCFYTYNGGKTWSAPEIPPHGYRSCVEYISRRKAIACGLNGVDYTSDGGRNWSWISQEGFHVCRRAKTGNAVFFAGNNGKIAKIVW